MKKLLMTAAVAAVTFTAAPAFAQGIGIDTPVGGVRIGEPYHHRYDRYDGPRYYDGGRYYHDGERRVFRDRAVRLRGGCRTVTIERDGFVKRIRRCD